MGFSWSKKEAKEPPLSSRLPVTIGRATKAQPTEQPRHLNNKTVETIDVFPAHNGVHCGFSTMTRQEVQQLNKKTMTTAETTALLESIQANKKFRDKIVAASTMAERMEIIGAKGFSCSTNELRTILNTVIDEKPDDVENNFTLWGNKIPG